MNINITKNIIRSFNITESPSLVHGLLCGYCCVNNNIIVTDWLKIIITNYNDNDDYSELITIFNATTTELADTGLNFNLLIADDTNLVLQARDVVDWCNGFLSGLGLAKINTNNNEVLELIKDISEIAKIDYNINNSNNDMNNLTEIIEFLRVGVLLLQEDINPIKIQLKK